MTGPLGYLWRTPDGTEVMIAPEEIAVVVEELGLSQAEALNNLAEAIRALDATLNRTDEISAQPSGQPGPAKGLVTHVRPQAEHRDRNARGSFTTIRADGFGFQQEEQQ